MIYFYSLNGHALKLNLRYSYCISHEAEYMENI